MTPDMYIASINHRYMIGNATEHTYRSDLQVLLEALLPNIRATNEPKRQKCGAPDYILTKKGIPIGFIEAKDIGDSDLEGSKKTGNKEQFDRYKQSLDNLIFTDYLDFHYYKNGVFVSKIAIGKIEGKKIKPITENFAAFERLIKEFGTYIGQSITSPKKLAEMMAGKARLLSDIIEKSLTSDTDNKEAWEFYIGGYQPAQKWLKDRKGRTLNFEDILYYQKIIHVLKATGEIMQEIDGVGD